MANYTLNYTGEKVDELLNKIDTACGNMSVNLSYTGATPTGTTTTGGTILRLTGAEIDKSYEEIMAAVKKGVNAYVAVTVDFSSLGMSGNFPMYIHIPFAFTFTREGTEILQFMCTIPLSTAYTAVIAIHPDHVGATLSS